MKESHVVISKHQIDELEFEYKQAKSSCWKESESLIDLQEKQKSILEAQQILQSIAKECQQRIHHRISQIVTDCLEAIFDDPYEFRVKFEKRRGKTEADLLLYRDGMELSDPVNEAGGTVVDVISFALRLANLLLSRPRRRRLLILDEPFKFVRRQYWNSVATLLVKLSEELDVQIIMVTNVAEFRIGKVIEL